MPKISVSVHNDFSSATRFANPSNVLTIMVALGLCYIFTKQLDFRFANTMLISIAFASYPILMNLFTSSIVNHFPHATLRYGVMLICAIILLPISYCGLRLLDLISKTEWYDRYHKTIAGFRTFTDIKTFLLQHWKQHAHQYLAIAFFYLLAIVSLLAMDNSLKLTPNVNYTYNTLIYTFCNKQSIIIFTAFLIWLMFKLFQSITKIGRASCRERV